MGDAVTLAVDFAVHDDAAEGPLQPGEIGVIVTDDGSEKPFQVDFGDRTWWYVAGALVHAAQAKVDAQEAKDGPDSDSIRSASPCDSEQLARDQILAAPPKVQLDDPPSQPMQDGALVASSSRPPPSVAKATTLAAAGLALSPSPRTGAKPTRVRPKQPPPRTRKQSPQSPLPAIANAPELTPATKHKPAPKPAPKRRAASTPGAVAPMTAAPHSKLGKGSGGSPIRPPIGAVGGADSARVVALFMRVRTAPGWDAPGAVFGLRKRAMPDVVWRARRADVEHATHRSARTLPHGWASRTAQCSAHATNAAYN